MRRSTLRPFARPGLLASAVVLAIAVGVMPWTLGAALVGGLAVVGVEQPDGDA